MCLCYSHLGPEDYIEITTTLTFTDTVTSIAQSIGIVDDLLFEPTEQFSISLSTNSDGCAISPGNEIVPVFIMDNGEMLYNAHCICNKLHRSSYVYLLDSYTTSCINWAYAGFGFLV